MKFLISGLSVSSITTTTPFGGKYTISDGMPFEVSDENDIEFFKSNPNYEADEDKVDAPIIAQDTGGEVTFTKHKKKKG